MALVLALACGAPCVLGQESATYSMRRVTLAAAADEATSLSFGVRATAGEISPAGGASFCNNAFAEEFGFWSILGGTPVPIVVSASRNAGDPSTVILAWSGIAPGFHVQRSPAPDDVLADPNLLTTTSACVAADPEPVAADDIFFYLVVPTGP